MGWQRNKLDILLKWKKQEKNINLQVFLGFEENNTIAKIKDSNDTD